jgi:hypothetical protein
MQLSPESTTEAQILADPHVRAGLAWGFPRRGHPEGPVHIHVQAILQYIDRQPWQEHRSDLRILALLHDSFKYKEKVPTGLVMPSVTNHAFLAMQHYARLKPGDSRLAFVLLHHDTPWRFYKQSQKGLFDEKLFKEIFSQVDLPLLIRFRYADLCERDTRSADWFVDKVQELGLLEQGFQLDIQAPHRESFRL